MKRFSSFNHARLRDLLQAKQWSAYDLMNEMIRRGHPVTPPTVYKWKRGQRIPNAEFLPTLAGIFGKDINYFFEPEAQHSTVKGRS